MAEKEPEVAKLNTEIEQLNKRLSQERINLDRASKAFRKKEAAARKKSEETQASFSHMFPFVYVFLTPPALPRVPVVWFPVR